MTARGGGEEARNAEVFRRIVNDVINDGRYEVADELMAESLHITRYGLASVGALLAGTPTEPLGSGRATSREQFKQAMRSLHAAFPDWHHTIHEVVAAGDTVAGRWTLECTFTGPFMGLPPTGARVVMDECGIMRFSGGRMHEFWGIGDELRFVQHLGVRCVLPARTAS